MIRKVHRITSFGVFDDFTWPNGLHEFKQFNLLFGWNYSGKTTLSRAFRCFELHKCHGDFEHAEVHLHCVDGTVHTLSAMKGPHHYRVFNTDFVHENVFFDDGHVEPILILGATDIAKQDQLKKKQIDLSAIQNEIGDASTARHDIERALDQALTAAARDNIKNPLMRPNYDKTKLLPKVDTCKADPAKGILADAEYATVLNTYNATEKRAEIENTPQGPLSSLSALGARVAEVSSRSVKSLAIEAVSESPELEQWVNTGRILHEGKTQCQFCRGQLPPDLLSKLADHFSTEYDELMDDLDGLEGDLKQAKAEAPLLPQSGFFYADLSVSFQAIASQLDELLAARRASLDLLLAAVATKQKRAFAPISSPVVEENCGLIENSISKVTALVNEHNKRSQEFDKNRESAFVKLERHWASRFALDQNYSAKLQQLEDLKANEQNKSAMKDELVAEIEKLERDLSEAVKGAETINDLMCAYFGKNDIRITVSEDKRFRITRNGAIAKNLSEGERSAVAFVHFMTRLFDEKCPLSETTVVVDDPICSLDANHLFNTYSFVKTKLSECHQLFVLTHNYEFYSLMKEWALHDEEKRKDKPQDTWKSWSIYLMRRKDDGTSTIETIPPELLKFKSEYHYLFATLLRFQKETRSDYDYLFSLPNITRRFMEAFGGIMIPTHQGLASKLPRIITNEVQRERVWKFINNFSHNNSLNRSLVIPDVSECKDVVAACLISVERWNATYYKDLVEAVQ